MTFGATLVDGCKWLTPLPARLTARKEILYLLNRKLSETQSQSGHFLRKEFCRHFPSYVKNAHRRGDKTPLIHTQTPRSRVILQKLTVAQ